MTPKPGPSPWLFVIAVILALGCMAGAIIAPIMQSSKHGYNDKVCQTNLRTIAQASLMYAAENDDRLPVEGWDRALQKFQSDQLVFSCPVQRRMDPRSSGYALSSGLAGKTKSEVTHPEEEVLAFDSLVTKPGAVAKPTDLARPARHDNGRTNNIVYADGHVKTVP